MTKDTPCDFTKVPFVVIIGTFLTTNHDDLTAKMENYEYIFNPNFKHTTNREYDV